MRKIYVTLLSAILAFGALTCVRAEVDAEAKAIIRDIVTGADNANQIRDLRVKNTVALPTGTITTEAISNNAVTGAKLAAAAVSQVDTNSTTTTSGYTATSVGQLLFGKTGSSGRVWRATALTATNWTLVLQSSL